MDRSDVPLSTLVGRVVDDAKAVAVAEVGVVKAKALGQVARYRTAAILFGIAAVLVFGAIVALFTGLVMTLATLIGPGLATLAVVVATLAIAALLAKLGADSMTRAGRP